MSGFRYTTVSWPWFSSGEIPGDPVVGRGHFLYGRSVPFELLLAGPGVRGLGEGSAAAGAREGELEILVLEDGGDATCRPTPTFQRPTPCIRRPDLLQWTALRPGSAINLSGRGVGRAFCHHFR